VLVVVFMLADLCLLPLLTFWLWGSYAHISSRRGMCAHVCLCLCVHASLFVCACVCVCVRVRVVYSVAFWEFVSHRCRTSTTMKNILSTTMRMLRQTSQTPQMSCGCQTASLHFPANLHFALRLWQIFGRGSLRLRLDTVCCSQSDPAFVPSTFAVPFEGEPDHSCGCKCNCD
jgi:hypothetical protein